jgi:hypothetical protein
MISFLRSLFAPSFLAVFTLHFDSTIFINVQAGRPGFLSGKNKDFSLTCSAQTSEAHATPLGTGDLYQGGGGGKATRA